MLVLCQPAGHVKRNGFEKKLTLVSPAGSFVSRATTSPMMKVKRKVPIPIFIVFMLLVMQQDTRWVEWWPATREDMLWKILCVCNKPFVPRWGRFCEIENLREPLSVVILVQSFGRHETESLNAKMYSTIENKAKSRDLLISLQIVGKRLQDWEAFCWHARVKFSSEIFHCLGGQFKI